MFNSRTKKSYRNPVTPFFMIKSVFWRMLPYSGSSGLLSQSAVGVEPGTKKGELTATLAMAAASIVNIVMLLFIVFGGSYVVTLLPQSVVDSLVFVLPAIFGGLIAQLAMQKPLWGVIGIALALTVNLGPVPTSLKAFCCIFGLVIICLLLEKLKKATA